MATDKKSFILYADLIDNIDHLTNEEKGILFTHLLDYVNDRNPVLEDRLILTAWKPIERQLKRDLKKFEQIKSKRSDAGKKSAELRALKKEERDSTNSTSVESVQHRSTNPTVNDNVNVNVNVITTIYEKFVVEVKEGKHQQATDQMYMRLKIKLGTLTPLLKNFYGQLIIDNAVPKNTLELRKHFNNWLNVQDRVGKLDEYKK
mgnify:FL=1